MEPPKKQAETDAEWLAARKRKRDAEESRIVEYKSNTAHAALLASPDSLGKNGTDRTDTAADFKLMQDFLDKLGISTSMCEPTNHTGRFNGVSDALFGLPHNSIREGPREAPQAVLLFLPAHGVDPESVPKDPHGEHYSALPVRDDGQNHVLSRHYFQEADEFKLRNHRPLQGGELFLHHLGFCGAEALLIPWIAAIYGSSNGYTDRKSNKHYVIILDSCFSGKLAEDLHSWAVKIHSRDQEEVRRWHVTIQAAASASESTYGGYFTPAFIALQDTERRRSLEKEWRALPEQDQENYAHLPFPSPNVHSTDPKFDPKALVFELDIQNLRIALFPSGPFFKYCVTRLFAKDVALAVEKRILRVDTAAAFLSARRFRVFDVKLKHYQGNPFGFFLLDDPSDGKNVICAHIHFGKTTDSIGCINLVHHRRPPAGVVALFEEDFDGLSLREHTQFHKISCAKLRHGKVARVGERGASTDDWLWASEERQDLADAKVLVTACYDWLEKQKPGWWRDMAHWRMQLRDKSLCQHFRSRTFAFANDLAAVAHQLPSLAALNKQELSQK